MKNYSLCAKQSWECRVVSLLRTGCQQFDGRNGNFASGFSELILTEIV
jgi:hypothetical protein